MMALPVPVAVPLPVRVRARRPAAGGDAAERAAYVASVVKALQDGPVSNKALGEKLAEYGVSLVIDLDDGQLEDYTTWHDELAKAIRAERAER